MRRYRGYDGREYESRGEHVWVVELVGLGEYDEEWHEYTVHEEAFDSLEEMLAYRWDYHESFRADDEVLWVQEWVGSYEPDCEWDLLHRYSVH